MWIFFCFYFLEEQEEKLRKWKNAAMYSTPTGEGVSRAVSNKLDTCRDVWRLLVVRYLRRANGCCKTTVETQHVLTFRFLSVSRITPSISPFARWNLNLRRVQCSPPTLVFILLYWQRGWTRLKIFSLYLSYAVGSVPFSYSFHWKHSTLTIPSRPPTFHFTLLNGTFHWVLQEPYFCILSHRSCPASESFPKIDAFPSGIMHQLNGKTKLFFWFPSELLLLPSQSCLVQLHFSRAVRW